MRARPLCWPDGCPAVYWATERWRRDEGQRVRVEGCWDWQGEMRGWGVSVCWIQEQWNLTKCYVYNVTFWKMYFFQKTLSSQQCCLDFNNCSYTETHTYIYACTHTHTQTLTQCSYVLPFLSWQPGSLLVLRPHEWWQIGSLTLTMKRRMSLICWWMAN